MVRVKKLKDILLNLTTNLNIDVMEGDKVIEVKNINVNEIKILLNGLTDIFISS